jgi:hypothetical protein
MVSASCRPPDAWSTASSRRPGITPSGPGMVPGHADDPGTVPSVLVAHDDLHIGHDRL